MTTEEKFDAAVNVIRNLPKNGAYQPSHELQLRFYAYYKQATKGACQQPKPAFWEVVKKAKWDAWMKLGNMSRQEAMNNYVDELKKIVETMSYTDNVANFLGSLDSFYESVPAEDLELLVGPVIERIRSQPGSPLSGSPLGSRETSPQRVRNSSRHITSSLETSPASSHSASPLPPDSDGDEEEEFKDTLESAPVEKSIKESKSSTGHVQSKKITQDQVKSATLPSNLTNGHVHNKKEDKHNLMSNEKHNNQDRSRAREKKTDRDLSDDIKNELINQMAETLQTLQNDLDRINGRVRSLEGQNLQLLAPQSERSNIYPRWWPLSDCSPRILAIIILWPFAAQFLTNIIRRYRQQRI
ncbi:acyl-CoA-binding domain-containing protein 4 [Microplitis mediator]|uniref:acyl-CoA-binding domain-containing protein 4 n=1 Tax=Microplitis mediator TaxID=375433 RepID=UPI002554D3A6|nr:acyl-CoA-binding domain-containing protein 4 [Microplitis mediator]